MAAQPLAKGETAPPPLSADILAKAKILLDRGTAEDRAVALIALHQHDQANQIIQDLKTKAGNPLDEAFRLLTMEGDNWYQAGQTDKAIEPYEKAMALKPEEVQARTNLALAHAFARLGSMAEHERRAIEICEGTLKLARRVRGIGRWRNIFWGLRGWRCRREIGARICRRRSWRMKRR